LYHFSSSSILQNSGFVANGWLNVDLFFVISGIVLDRRYFSNLNASFADFIASRIARMMPLYFVMLLLFFALDLLIGRSVEELLYPLAVNVAALQSFGLLPKLYFYGPAWSISAEIWVNMFLFPILALWDLSRVLLLFIGGGLAIFVFFLDIQSSYEAGALRCLYGVSVGVLVSRISKKAPSFNSASIEASTYRPTSTTTAIAVLAWLAAIAACFHVNSLFAFVPIVFGALCYALILGYVQPIEKFLSQRLIVYLGNISFSVYMIHFFIGGRLMRGAIPFISEKFELDLVSETTKKKWNGTVLGTNELEGLLFIAIYISLVVFFAHFILRYVEHPLHVFFKEMIKGTLSRKRTK